MNLAEKLGIATAITGITSLIGFGLIDSINYGFRPHFYHNNDWNSPHMAALYAAGCISLVLESIVIFSGETYNESKNENGKWI